MIGWLILVALAAAEPADCSGSTGVRAVHEVRHVVLDEPHVYTWTRDQPRLLRVSLLVVEVEPDCVVPRQVGVPVLYVGESPAERINVGWPSGRLVVLTPGHVDLATTPVFFGSDELPERVDPERGRWELERARRTAGGARVHETATTALPPLHLADPVALYAAAADLIDEWAPDESERAGLLRLPAGE